MPGDRSKLQELERKMARLGQPMAQRQLGGQIARVALAELRAGVAASRDPYGRRYAPLARGTRRPLGRIAGTFSAGAEGGGFGMRAGREYVRYHQEGAVVPARRVRTSDRSFDLRTGRFLSASRARRRSLVGVSRAATTFKSGVIPQRQLVPEPSTGGMGEIWGNAINERADAWLRSYFGV